MLYFLYSLKVCYKYLSLEIVFILYFVLNFYNFIKGMCFLVLKKLINSTVKINSKVNIELSMWNDASYFRLYIYSQLIITENRSENILYTQAPGLIPTTSHYHLLLQGQSMIELYVYILHIITSSNCWAVLAVVISYISLGSSCRTSCLTQHV